MTMAPQHKINYLIALYLNNELSGQEKEMAERWCREHPQEYNFLRDAYLNQPDFFQVDTDKAWERVSSSVAQYRLRKRHHLLIAFSVAASVLLLAGVFILNHLNSKSEMPLTALPEGVFESKGTLQECHLPDGSKVVLHKNSRLTYDWRNERVRNTTLDGEAYFEVKHNPERKFTVETHRQEITVLGTSFVVNTRPADGDEAVWVNTGKVTVRSLKANQRIVLERGEGARLQNDRLHREQHNDANLYGWATRELQFTNRLLPEVIEILEKTYDIPIVLEAKNPTCRVTANFRQEPLDKVLKELSAITGFSYKESGNGYLITDVQCP